MTHGYQVRVWAFIIGIAYAYHATPLHICCVLTSMWIEWTMDNKTKPSYLHTNRKPQQNVTGKETGTTYN